MDNGKRKRLIKSARLMLTQISARSPFYVGELFTQLLDELERLAEENDRLSSMETKPEANAFGVVHVPIETGEQAEHYKAPMGSIAFLRTRQDGVVELLGWIDQSVAVCDGAASAKREKP
jgi:hypothetical protein